MKTPLLGFPSHTSTRLGEHAEIPFQQGRRQQPDLRRRLLRGRRDRCSRSRRGSLPHSAVGCKFCVRAVRIGAENREEGSCGGGFPAGGAGRRTAARLQSVAIATSGAAVPAAAAGSSAPRWRGGDHSDRMAAEAARAASGAWETGAPASLLESLSPCRALPFWLTLWPFVNRPLITGN